MERLTSQEEEIMKIVWHVGEGTIKEYHDRTPEPRMPYTTFSYLIDTLHRKGFLHIRRIGITKLCSPAIEADEYARVFVSTLIRSHFSNSYKEMVSFFVRDRKIKKEELQELIDLIERGEEA